VKSSRAVKRGGWGGLVFDEKKPRVKKNVKNTKNNPQNTGKVRGATHHGDHDKACGNTRKERGTHTGVARKEVLGRDRARITKEGGKSNKTSKKKQLGEEREG